jgi:16S rRNA G966 N2-methylase RsmD
MTTLKQNVNVLKKIFPEPHDGLYEGLNIDNEGLYSITHPKEAEIISQNIITIMGTNELNILDMTAGCGGNMISFAKYFTHAVGVEVNEARFKLLENNMKQYNYHNYSIILGNSIDYVNETNSYDVYYIDPPWGGPDYKKNKNLSITLSGVDLYNIVLSIPLNKLIILKLPFNYNIDIFKNNIIKQIKMNNINILFIRY